MKKLREWIFPVLILAICFFLAWKNYSFGTWLSGWDNLHPEFDFKLNIVRSLNAAWQEYQGLGLLGGMAHAADLPRQLILWLFSFFIPGSFIRYLWTFLMLGAGPLGAYFLIKGFSSRTGGFVGAIFYLLNLATVQYFYLPFETFVGFFGFLPWLLYFAVGYLKTGKNIIGFFLISVLATCAFYVQTLFIVYALFLLAMCLGTVLKRKNKGVLRSVRLFLVTFAVNAFWLLPVVWFGLTSGNIPVNSRINRISTSETAYMNRARGDFSSIAGLKGYWFDYYDFSESGQFDYLFADWISHTDSPWVGRTGIFLFAAAILGLVWTRKFTWLILLGAASLMLTGLKMPGPLLAEIFRNSFTKWSVGLALVISLGLGALVSGFRKFSIIPAILIVAASVYIAGPVFKGKLISERMRVDIPNEYSVLFKWFENKPQEGRITFFPFFNFWGWNYHSWGYDGGGFLWYGIKQPILDRAFNVWSPRNETYQNQISLSLYNRDTAGFGNVLKKYKVKYVLLDESVTYPGGDQEMLFVSEVKGILSDLNYQVVFEDGFLAVYETPYDTNRFITTPGTYMAVDADLTYSSADPVYEKFGDYIQSAAGVSYPFVNFDSRSPVGLRVDDGNRKLIIENRKTGSEVMLPTDNMISETFGPDRGFKEVFNCDLKKAGTVSRENLGGKRIYKAFDGGVACDFFNYPDLKFEQAYVVRIKGENIRGRSLKIYLQNWATDRMDLEELLPEGKFDNYFVVLPKKVNGGKEELSGGYTLNIETRSFGRIASENIIEGIEIYPFDIDFLINLTGNSEEPEIRINDLRILSVKKIGTAFYRVDTEGTGLLELGQGYEPGWVAFGAQPSGFGKLSHVKVNSWANGWIIPDGQPRVYLFFWPQLLEWGGFVILFRAITLLVLAPGRKKKTFPVDRGGE